MRIRCKTILFLSLIFVPWLYGNSAATEPIKLGGTLGFTGKYSPMSEMVSKGLKLWATQTNEKGGLLGRPIEVIIYDDKSDPDVARELYTKLVLEDKVDLVFGPFSSVNTIEAINIVEKYGYSMLAAGSTSDRLWQQGHTHLFGVYIPASRYSFAFMKLLLRNNIERVAIVAADDMFSITVAEGSQKWAERLGLEVTLYKIYKKGTKELDDLARQIRDSRAEAIIVGGHFDEAVDVRLALANIDWYPRAYFATLGPALQEYYEILQDKAEYSFTQANWEEKGVRFPGSHEFSQKFRKAYGKKPSYQAAAGFAVGQILEAAINNIKSLDKKKLRDVLATQEIVTVLGRYGVDDTGQQIRHFALVTQWQNGKLEVVGPADMNSISTVQPIFK